MSVLSSSSSSYTLLKGEDEPEYTDHKISPAEVEYGTFVAAAAANKYFEPVEGYEGAHRYDPDYTWNPSDEKKVVRRIDKRICSWVCLMFFALQLDRGNIAQALSDNLLGDLGLNTNDYNTGQTIFLIAFIFAELPSQLVSKALGPDRWIPIQMICWSFVAALQSLLTNGNSYFISRALLGFIEGGFIPDCILYLSYYYTSKELPTRLSWFWTTYQFTHVVSAFLAYGILHLRGYYGIAGWRWLFAIEGVVTGSIGALSYFYLPPSPCQTASRFRGKNGWFNEHEEKIMVNRILRDDPSKGDMHNRQALPFSMVLECLQDWHMWPIYILGLTWLIPGAPVTQYLTLQLKDIGFDTFQTNLLTVPAYILFMFQCLFWTWVSEKFEQRFLVGLVNELYTLPLLVIMELIPLGSSAWAKWALSSLVVGHPYVHPVIVAITSRNAGTVRTRTVASALYNMSVQVGSIFAYNIYREDDKPMYRRGNKILIAITVYNIILFIGVKNFYSGVNKKRDRIWNALSSTEKERYLATTEDKGNKRLDFRFAH